MRTSQENTKRRNDISSESPEEKEPQKRKAYYPEKEKSDESLQDSDSSDPLTPRQSQGILQLTSPDKQEKIFEESEESKSLSSRRRRKLQRSQVQVMLQREKDNKDKLKDIFSASKPSRVNVHIPGTKLKQAFSEQVNEASERSRKVEKAPKRDKGASIHKD